MVFEVGSLSEDKERLGFTHGTSKVIACKKRLCIME